MDFCLMQVLEGQNDKWHVLYEPYSISSSPSDDSGSQGSSGEYNWSNLDVIGVKEDELSDQATVAGCSHSLGQLLKVHGSHCTVTSVGYIVAILNSALKI